MTVQNMVAEFKRLSREEQAELFDQLAELVDAQTEPLVLTPAQRVDLRDRIEEYRSGRADMIDGEAFVAKLRSEL